MFGRLIPGSSRNRRSLACNSVTTAQHKRPQNVKIIGSQSTEDVALCPRILSTLRVPASITSRM